MHEQTKLIIRSKADGSDGEIVDNARKRSKPDGEVIDNHRKRRRGSWV